MLVRLDNNELIEYPDEVGAWLLADPSHGDVPDYSLEEINCLISGGFAALYDDALTLAQNIEQAKQHYTRWGKPTTANMEKALAQINFYKENVAPADVVSMGFEANNETSGGKIRQPNANGYIIENMAVQSPKLLAAEMNANDDAVKNDANGTPGNR